MKLLPKHCDRRRIFFYTLCFLVLLPTLSAWADSDDHEVATRLARNHLEQLDAMQGDQVWEAGTLLFQTRHEKQQWLTFQKVRRQLYGPLFSRHLHKVTEKSTYYSVPDGRYLFVQFMTSFANKQTATETVIFDASEPGTWKIADLILN